MSLRLRENIRIFLMMPYFKTLIPLAIFYIGWWGLILLVLGSYSVLWQVALALVALCGNMALIQNRKAEVLWALAGALIGYVIDSTLQNLGILYFSQNLDTLAPQLGPPWLFLLWLLFTSSFLGIEYLERSRWLAVLVGAIGGPFCYWLGQPLGLVTYGSPLWMSLSVHVILWGLLLPGGFYLRRRFFLRR